jgi:pimeloyl-ACP methyl ester carboxylesterase
VPELNSLTAADCSVAYRRSGSGETVLLVHGITTNSFIWGPILDALATSFDVVAVDLLGCGGSDLRLDLDYSLAGQADCLAELIHDLDIEPCHLVGHDIGGGIAQIISVRHRRRIRSMTVINPVGYDFWPVQPIIAMRTPILRQLVMATLDRWMLRAVVKRALCRHDLVDDRLMDLFWDQMSTPQRRKAFLHLARSLDASQLTSIVNDLRRLDLPTLILRGDGDVYLSPRICEQLHSDIPGSRFERIPTGGHFVQIDEPEWVVDRLATFLHGVPA